MVGKSNRQKAKSSGLAGGNRKTATVPIEQRGAPSVGAGDELYARVAQILEQARAQVARGVSGAIKKRAGLAPFRDVARHGPIPLGQAVATSAGRLPFKLIIHVAGINMLWRASEHSIRDSVSNALRVAREHGIRSLALPLIGAGSGGFDADRVLSLMVDTLDPQPADLEVTLVRFKR